MKTLRLVSHLTDLEIKENLSINRKELTHSRWKIIYLIQIGKMTSAELLVPIVDLSVHSIYKIVAKYNREGVASIIYKPKGGRLNAYLTIEEEKELFLSLEDRADKGQIKTAQDIRLLVEEKTGHPISDDYLWSLFQKNGWKKKMPRPYQVEKGQKDKLEIKKYSPKIWSPPG